MDRMVLIVSIVSIIVGIEGGYLTFFLNRIKCALVTVLNSMPKLI